MSKSIQRRALKTYRKRLSQRGNGSVRSARAPQVAEISPYTPKNSERLNPLKDSVLFEGDIISPLEEKWDCEL